MGTFINALVGAVAGVLLSFIPFSTLLGGAVAGFLEGPDGREGTVTGAISGLFMLVPVALGGFFVLGFLGFGVGAGGIPATGFLFALLFFAFFALVTLAYTVGLAALGGYLGAYLAGDYPDQRVAVYDAVGTSPPDGQTATHSEARHDPARERPHSRGDPDEYVDVTERVDDADADHER
ncbi:DUF5518 domain-containing protein [Natronobiforma cellulositropha]|uniref:DUF5518 domain-containing protein n=1 Tax=Natronobiforma cellulositropha TaxID=1679076 RepID=UPI0021D5D647|nr:DUF5518 domain-containing protein [Natronobiforma cellulositropha]